MKYKKVKISIFMALLGIFPVAMADLSEACKNFILIVNSKLALMI